MRKANLFHLLGILVLLLSSHSFVSNSLWPHEQWHARLPCPSLSPGVCSNSCPVNLWCYLAISSSVTLFSFCLQYFPASGSFLMSHLFISWHQSIGASALVLPMNSQSWFPLGLTGLNSLLSKGLTKVSPAPQFESINSSALSLFSGPTLTFIHDYWKNHSFDYAGFCQQSDVLAF